MRFAKRVLGTIVALALASAAAAAVPGVINYQGRVTDNTPQQNPIDATVTVNFSVWDSQTGGASLWSETQSVQVVKGLFNVLLGSTTPIPGGVFSGGATRYLEIVISGETLTPRQRIATTPYASVSGSADNATALGGIGASAYQQRIGTPCPAGYAINAVAADGTATCIQGLQGPPGPAGAGLETGAISGTVVNCAGPQAGILVYVPGRSTTAYSAGDGSYLLSYLPAGSYTVQYRPVGTGGATSANGIAVTAGQTTGQGTTNIADVTQDAANCGSCGAACSSNHIPVPTCANGNCTGFCALGFSDCNTNLRTDGCETSTTSSTTNCGGCGIACSSNHVTPACNNSICSGTCESGFANCDNNFQTNGCERSVSNDPLNCGGCNGVCSSNHIPAPTCTAGLCTGACSSGFLDCNNNKAVDGCEVDTSTSIQHCGGCYQPCAAGESCVAGSCF